MMAWSDAARAAALQARRLRKNLSGLGKRDRAVGRRAVFEKLRSEAGMDRIVRTGGTITYTDPYVRSRNLALTKIAKLQRKADTRRNYPGDPMSGAGRVARYGHASLSRRKR